MKTLKLLFTSVGRRVELVQAFRKAADELETNLKIIGADITTTAPALFFCDQTVQVCKIKDPNYISELIDICEKEQVNVLIPTIDTDLLLLSQYKDQFQKIGTVVMVSEENKIKVCRDKRFTAAYFHSVGLNSPDPVDDYLSYQAVFLRSLSRKMVARVFLRIKWIRRRN